MRWLTRKRLIETITIDEDAIRYVRVKSVNPIQVEKAEAFMLPPNLIVEGKITDKELLALQMGEAAQRWKLGKVAVQFLAPDAIVLIRKVQYEAEIQADELKSYFFIEIGSSIYLPFDDVAFDVLPYRQVNEKMNEALLIAARESIIEQYEQVFTSNQLTAVHAEISPLALYRLGMATGQITETKQTALVELTTEETVVVGIFDEQYPLFMQRVDFQKTRAMTIQLEEVEAKEASSTPYILSELTKIFNFYQYNLWNGEKQVEQIILTGTHPALEDLQQALQTRVSFEVELLAPAGIQLTNGQAIDPAYYRAVGLALKEVM